MREGAGHILRFDNAFQQVKLICRNHDPGIEQICVAVNFSREFPDLNLSQAIPDGGFL
jgi:hypothetical protein